MSARCWAICSPAAPRSAIPRHRGRSTSSGCDCALDRLLGYITDLRGMTRGRGQFTMTFDRFDVA
ncbi:MAG: hypothetical protein U1F59_08645 [Candidatus Competibacteraceae bacterium]